MLPFVVLALREIFPVEREQIKGEVRGQFPPLHEISETRLQPTFEPVSVKCPYTLSN
jgi:hypothetical protein